MEGFEIMGKMSDETFLKNMLFEKKNAVRQLRLEKQISNKVYEEKLIILEKDAFSIEQQLEGDE